MASRKKKVAQKSKNPMLPFEPLSRDKPMPVTARRERPPKPLGSTCGAGVRGGRGARRKRTARGPNRTCGPKVADRRAKAPLGPRGGRDGY